MEKHTELPWDYSLATQRGGEMIDKITRILYDGKNFLDVSKESHGSFEMVVAHYADHLSAMYQMMNIVEGKMFFSIVEHEDQTFFLDSIDLLGSEGQVTNLSNSKMATLCYYSSRWLDKNGKIVSMAILPILRGVDNK